MPPTGRPIGYRGIACDPYSVEWYGAVGDGAVDDTASIPAALDAAAAAGGGVVYLPRGVYRITDTLLVGSNVTVRGDGPGATILRGKVGNYAGKTSGGTTIAATLAAVGANHVSVQGLTVDHQTNLTTANGIAFLPASVVAQDYQGTPCTDVAVHGVEVFGNAPAQYLIWSFRSQRIKVTHCTLDGYWTNGASTQEGIEIAGGYDVLVSKNQVKRIGNHAINVSPIATYDNMELDGLVVSDNVVQSSPIGIFLATYYEATDGAQNLSNVVVAGNVVRDCTDTGILMVTGTAGSTVENLAIVDNEVSGGPVAIHLSGLGADTSHRNVLVAGNQCIDQTSVALGAITVTSWHRAVVSDNRVAACAGVGIRVTGAVDVSVVGNEIHGSVSRAVDADTVTRFAMNDNRFVDVSTAGATYGCLIANATDSVALRNTCSMATAFAPIAMTGDRGRLADNVYLSAGAATPWINLCTNANASFAAPAAPVAAAAFVDVANTLATNAANLSAQIRVTQTAGAPNPVTVTRIATGFRLTLAAAAVGNENYAWEIVG